MRTVEARLDGPADFPGWRAQARRLLAAGVPPEAVEWRLPGEAPGLFATATLPAAGHLSEPRTAAENPTSAAAPDQALAATPPAKVDRAPRHLSEQRITAESATAATTTTFPDAAPDHPPAAPRALRHLSEHRMAAANPIAAPRPDAAIIGLAPTVPQAPGHPPGSGAPATAEAAAAAGTPAPSVPRAFVDLAGTAIRHRDPERFALLYRVLWRLTHGEPALVRVAIDPDIARLETMAKAVRRDAHKMHAFVRFREVAAVDGPRFVSWFEPEHHILEAEAGFFVRRFATMRWSILTPAASAHWDGAALSIGPGARRADAPAEDAREDLWLAYYASIFNPARLKPDAMRAEMPVKYWRNLPEARLIPRLIAEAPRRTAEMVERGATAPAPRRQRDVHRPMRPGAMAGLAVAIPDPGASVAAPYGCGTARSDGLASDAPSFHQPDLRRPAHPAVAFERQDGAADRRPSVPASPSGWNAHGPAQPNPAQGVTGTMPADLFTAAVDPAEGLAALRAEMLALNSLPPWTADATQMVFGEGPVGAPLLFVGEQPGDEEDIAGKPFVGPAGRMFNKALEEAGVPRTDAYVTNAVKHFKFKPTGRRRLHQSPDAGDIAYYRPFLKREIELVGPQLVVTLGATALRALSGKPLAINKTRGEVMPMPDGPPIFPTVHPSYLLRLPDPDSKAREYERFVADLKRAYREVA